MDWLGRLPLFVLMIGIAGAMMLVPAIYAAVTHYHDISRIFLLSAVLIFGLPGYPEWVKRPHARGVRDE